MFRRFWLWCFDKWVAEVRRESRQRTLDELLALIAKEPIQAGVGVDVEAVYWQAITVYERQRGSGWPKR